jgi:hypothetical protein
MRGFPSRISLGRALALSLLTGILKPRRAATGSCLVTGGGLDSNISLLGRLNIWKEPEAAARLNEPHC